MGLIWRVVMGAAVVFAFMSLLRAGLCRLWPSHTREQCAAVSRIISWLDRVLRQARRVAVACAGLVLFVFAAKMAVVNFAADEKKTKPRQVNSAEARPACSLPSCPGTRFQ